MNRRRSRLNTIGIIHNLHLMAGTYEFKGQIKQAEQLLREFFALRANDGFFGSYQGDWPRFLLSRGRYAEDSRIVVEPLCDNFRIVSDSETILGWR